jgi:hypothetical protein
MALGEAAGGYLAPGQPGHVHEREYFSEPGGRRSPGPVMA